MTFRPGLELSPVQIPAGSHVLTAADPLSDDLRDAVKRIAWSERVGVSMTVLARRMRDTAGLLELLADRHRVWVVWCDLQGRWTATRPPRPAEWPSRGSYLVWRDAQILDELVIRLEDLLVGSVRLVRVVAGNVRHEPEG